MNVQAKRTTFVWTVLILFVSGLVAVGIFYWVMSIPRDPDRVEFWLYKLEHGDDQWRGTSANVLAALIGPPEARGDLDEIQGVESQGADIRAALIEALEDPDPVVRRNAVGGLRNVEAARPLIRECLDDPDPEVRRLARAVLDKRFLDQSGENHEADRLGHDPEN